MPVKLKEMDKHTLVQCLDMEDRRGPYTLTRNGVEFHLLDPSPNEVRLDDIAHSLAWKNRFNAHTQYTNAQHSIRVSRLCREYKLAGLLHDSAEAYTGDIIRPFQEAMGSEFKALYKKIESNILKVIAEKFGFEWPLPPEVIEMDDMALQTELDDLRNKQCDGWGSELAEYLFRQEFARLTEGKK